MTSQPASDPKVSAAAEGHVASTGGDAPAYRKPWIVALFVALVAGLLAIDLVIKDWSFEHVAGVPVVLDRNDPDAQRIPWHESKVVVPHILSLHLVTNTGAVFGSAKGAKPLFVVVSIAAVGVVGWLFLRSSAKAWLFHLGLALVLSGALGNLYDRLVYSAVRDMFYLFPGVNLPFGLTWPGGKEHLYPWIFNFADVALVVGVILLAILSWRYDMQQRTASKARG